MHIWQDCFHISSDLFEIHGKKSVRQSLALLKIPGASLANQSAPGFLSRYHRRFLAHYWSYLKKPDAPLVNQLTPGFFSRFFWVFQNTYFFSYLQTISQIRQINQHQVFLVVIDGTYLKNLVLLWKSTCTSTKETWCISICLANKPKIQT